MLRLRVDYTVLLEHHQSTRCGGSKGERVEPFHDGRLTVRFVKLHPEARPPAYARAGDAGMDLCSTEQYVLQSGERHLFGTGIALEIPAGLVGLVWDRSSLGSSGITSFGGVIDSSYRGEIKVTLFNSGTEDHVVRVGDRIAQMLIQPVLSAHLMEAEALTTSERGERGFGSTGR